MRTTFLAAIVALLAGCSLLEPEYRRLDRDDPVVAAILASGESQEAKLEAMSDYVGHPVVDFGDVGEDLVAKLTDPVNEALTATKEEILSNLGKAKSPIDFLAILAGGLLTGGGVLISRTSEKKGVAKK